MSKSIILYATLGKMNFIERFMIKKTAKVTESINTLNEDAIKEFANSLNQATL